MKEPDIEVLNSKGTDFLWLYASISKLWYKYFHCNNYIDRNYIFMRKDVKPDEQNVYMLMKTSHHCYTVTHYCVLDGTNELKKFNKLFDAAQYFMQSWEDYERKYSEYKAEEARAKEERRHAKEAARVAKTQNKSVLTREGEQ